MAAGDLRDQIAGIEAHIDELAKTLDGCRKAILFSKVAMAAGGIWIFANLFGKSGLNLPPRSVQLRPLLEVSSCSGQISLRRSKLRQQ